MAKFDPPVCARCGHDRLTYRESKDKEHILLPFGIPSDAPLDDESIKRYVVDYMTMAVKMLHEIRTTRKGGERKSNIILPH